MHCIGRSVDVQKSIKAFTTFLPSSSSSIVVVVEVLQLVLPTQRLMAVVRVEPGVPPEGLHGGDVGQVGGGAGPAQDAGLPVLGPAGLADVGSLERLLGLLALLDELRNSGGESAVVRVV